MRDGVYQLQYRAFEAQGEGSWTDLEKEIPVTKKKEKLDDLGWVLSKSTSPSAGASTTNTSVSITPATNNQATYPSTIIAATPATPSPVAKSPATVSPAANYPTTISPTTPLPASNGHAINQPT